MRTRIKICCISSTTEAKVAIHHGADALGLVGKMPSGPGPIPDWLSSEIIKTIPPPIASFLLTSEQASEEIIYHVKRVGTNTVQIVDELTTGTYDDIRTALPHLKIVQVIHVSDGQSIEEAVRVAPSVDALLLDSGNPRASLKTLGGTGNVHNWEISREIVKAVDIPVFLAGGLHSNNVRQAIEIVKPFGVDICSGVRTEGRLDPDKLGAFIKAVHSR
ncbi:MAG TPA: phosphoribosylanthranilate isomerase [Chitinophagaceae bacterium]|nr:phosphoribosylanthranilate isomerase [Chitinophagaceae bacterium]